MKVNVRTSLIIDVRKLFTKLDNSFQILFFVLFKTDTDAAHF